MQLSLSVRIAEAPCKTRLHLPFEEILEVAAKNGYGAICMRATWPWWPRRGPAATGWW